MVVFYMEAIRIKAEQDVTKILDLNTRKDRRSLLTLSLATIFLVYPNLFPEAIAVLGPKFSATDHQAMLLMMDCLVVYFLFVFLFIGLGRFFSEVAVASSAGVAGEN
jgi:hypothetical protein